MSNRRYTEALPPLDRDIYDTLRADIRLRGIISPIIVDEDHNIIDGYHRHRIANELGVECPSITRKGLTEEEKHREAVDLNLHRRHLTREQRQQIVATLSRQGTPQREIARGLGVSQMTVSRDLGTVQTNVSREESSSRNERTIGKDSKSYLAKRKAPAKRNKTTLVNSDGFQRAVTLLGMFDSILPEPTELVKKLDDHQKKNMRRQVEVALHYLVELKTIISA